MHEEAAKDLQSASRFLVCSRQRERLVLRLLLGAGCRRRAVGGCQDRAGPRRRQAGRRAAEPCFTRRRWRWPNGMGRWRRFAEDMEVARRRRRRQSKAKRARLPLCVHDWPAEASVGCLNLSFGRHAVQAKDADMVSYEHVSAAVAVVVAVDQEPHAVRSLPCGGGTGRTQGFTFVGRPRSTLPRVCSVGALV